MRTEVISGAPSPASAGRARTRPAAPASESVVRKRRRVCINGIAKPPLWKPSLPGLTRQSIPDLALGGFASMPGSSPGMTTWSCRSCLQLAFELVHEAPIGAVGDDLLRARFDHAGFMQAQRVESEGILVIVFPPFIVRHLAQGLQGIIIAGREAAIHEPLRDAGRVGGAQSGSLQYRPQCPFG